MAITVQVRTERGTVLDQMVEGAFELERALPGYDDSDYPYLRLVDPYGNTVFSRFQMPVVVPELERLGRTHPSPALERVLEMARFVSGEPHTYLWLIGD